MPPTAPHAYRMARLKIDFGGVALSCFEEVVNHVCDGHELTLAFASDIFGLGSYEAPRILLEYASRGMVHWGQLGKLYRYCFTFPLIVQLLFELNHLICEFMRTSQ